MKNTEEDEIEGATSPEFLIIGAVEERNEDENEVIKASKVNSAEVDLREATKPSVPISAQQDKATNVEESDEGLEEEDQDLE